MSPKATPASFVNIGGIQKHARTICWVKTISFYKSAFIFVQGICIVPHTPNSVCKNTHRKQETSPWHTKKNTHWETHTLWESHVEVRSWGVNAASQSKKDLSLISNWIIYTAQVSEWEISCHTAGMSPSSDSCAASWHANRRGSDRGRVRGWHPPKCIHTHSVRQSKYGRETVEVIWCCDGSTQINKIEMHPQRVIGTEAPSFVCYYTSPMVNQNHAQRWYLKELQPVIYDSVVKLWPGKHVEIPETLKDTASLTEAHLINVITDAAHTPQRDQLQHAKKMKHSLWSSPTDRKVAWN